mgnify:CR=1 FL=1
MAIRKFINSNQKIKDLIAENKELSLSCESFQDAYQKEAECTRILKDEYSKLFKEYTNLENKHNSVATALKIMQCNVTQMSDYTDEQVPFKSVQAYAAYVKIMIDTILKYNFPKETEKEEES